MHDGQYSVVMYVYAATPDRLLLAAYKTAVLGHINYNTCKNNRHVGTKIQELHIYKTINN